ncbi:MAG: UvrD-helicase domain-containing protein [Spirochaetaceae bacterium]
MAELNRRQQEAVAARSNSVVTAGAGSGKTTVLARRYLALLEEGVPVERILCLTFTRKAAAEMYERVYRSLLEGRRDSPAASRALANFEEAQISTLDSFSGRILRSAAARYGLNPDFRVDEEELQALLEAESLQFLLRSVDTPGMKLLLSSKGFTQTWRKLLQPLGLSHFSLPRQEPLIEYASLQRRRLADGFAESLSQVREGCEILLQLDPGISKTIGDGFHAARAVEELLDEQRVAGVRQAIVTGEGAAEVSAWVDALGKAVAGTRKQHGSNPAYEFLRTGVTLIKDETIKLREIAESLPLIREDLLELLEEYRGRIHAVKRELGLLSYQDVVELSICALRDDKELRRYYKAKFSQIMIDEFQDNNNDQRELLFLLAEAQDVEREGIPPAAALEAGKLFFVGDEKQSIYRFRGADVSVFKGLSAELSEAGGRSLSLTRNYRSEPALIDAFNALFSRVFREHGEPYQARYEPLEAREEPAPLNSRFELAILDGADRDPESDQENSESEANWVARTIRELLTDPAARVRDRKSGELRRPKAGDIAVLFRSGGNQHVLEKMLRLHGVPYGTQSVRSFFLEAPAYDIFAFLSSLLYPEDRVAYAALLRSPFGSLGDDSLVEILLDGRGAFEAPEQTISEPGDRERYRRLREKRSEVLELVDRVPLTELIDFLWHEAGYRQFLLSDPTNHPYLEHYDYLFQLALEYDNRPLEDFLRFLRAGLGNFERLNELNLPEGSGRVELLTIHRSKGLEFPLVFVMDAGNTGGGNAGELFYWMEEYGPLFNIADSRGPGGKRSGNYFLRRAEDLEKLKEQAELRRLLYVAATRAESHLYISGYLHGKNRNQKEPKAFLHLLAEAIDLDLASLIDWPTTALAGRLTLSRISPLSRQEYLGLFSRLPKAAASGERLYEGAAEIQEPRLLRRIIPSEFNSFARARVAAAEGGPGSPESIAPADNDGRRDGGATGGAVERALGTLTHRLIELQIRSLREGGPSEPDPEWVAELFSDIPEGVRERTAKEATAMAEGFLNSEIWKNLEGAARLESELSVLSRYDHPELGPLFVQGQFDLYAELPEVCWVLDFKTDRNLEPREYRYQLSLYRDAAEKLSGRPVETAVFGLRDALASEIPAVSPGELDDLLFAYVLG